MENNLKRDYFLLAHVDLERVRYQKEMDLGIEFTNEIDAWSKMIFKFRNSRSSPTYAERDLHPLVYGVRSRLE